MKLSVIPQEPTLFKGSIRTNLDPLGLHSDDEIWKALEKCQLKTTIMNLPNLLDSSVSDEGENWKRQLFVLEEFYSEETKSSYSMKQLHPLIPPLMPSYKEFSTCTVITVAHRVPTVIDGDKVMVLSFGKMVEYDEPLKLLD